MTVAPETSPPTLAEPPRCCTGLGNVVKPWGYPRGPAGSLAQGPRTSISQPKSGRLATHWNAPAAWLPSPK